MLNFVKVDQQLYNYGFFFLLYLYIFLIFEVYGCMKDARELGISIEVLPLGQSEETFNMSLFYAVRLTFIPFYLNYFEYFI